MRNSSGEMCNMKMLSNIESQLNQSTRMSIKSNVSPESGSITCFFIVIVTIRTLKACHSHCAVLVSVTHVWLTCGQLEGLQRCIVHLPPFRSHQSALLESELPFAAGMSNVQYTPAEGQ